MQSRKILSLLIVALLAVGPVFAWPAEFGDENKNYVPDQADTLLCGSGEMPDQAGECEDGRYESPYHHLLPALCDDSLPTDESCDEEYWLGPDALFCDQLPEDGNLGTCDEDHKYSPPVNESGSETDLLEDLLLLGWDSVATLINTAGREQAARGRGNTSMVPASGDADEDGRPDAYLLAFDTTRDCDHPTADGDPCPGATARRETVYVQSDYIWSNGEPEGMLVDPRRGDALRADLVVNQEEERIWIQILKNADAVHTRITLDWSAGEKDQLVLQVFDDEDSRIQAPRYAGVHPLGIEEGTPVYWSADFDLSKVVFLDIGDLDRDGSFDHVELLTGSNPLNKRSTPANMDGDACPRATDPDDSNPLICKGFPYILEAVTPDSDPTDGKPNLVWEIVPLTFSAALKPDFDPELTPEIKSWHAYISFAETRAHSGNDTVKADKTAPPCDILPTSSTKDNAQHGTDFDGDPMDHGQCPYWSPPLRQGEETSWQVWTHVCQGTGHLTAEICLFDTKTIADGKDYHFFFEVCLVGEDCPQMYGQGLDMADHIGLSDHFEINNKPFLTLHSIIDADNVSDRDGRPTPISDFALLNITSWHGQGYDMGLFNVKATSYMTKSDGKQGVHGAKQWTFNVAGATEGTRIPSSAEGGFNGADPIDPENATAYITLVNAATNNWTIEIDTKEIPWRATSFRGFLVDVTAQAVQGPPITIKDWPTLWEVESGLAAKVQFFNNRAPEVRDLRVEEFTKESDDPNTTVTVRFRYFDPDSNGATPTLTAFLHDKDTDDVVAQSASCSAVPDPVSDPNSVLNPSRAYNRDYRCDIKTERYDDHNVTILAIDADRGENTAEIVPLAISIANLAPELDDFSLESDPADATQSGSNRTVTFHIRYHDAEDDAESVDIEIFTRPESGAPESLGSFPMATGTTCVGNPLRADKGGVQSDHCASVDLAPGNYSLKIDAQSLRDHTAVFPPAGLEDFDVGDIVEIECNHCLTDEETMNLIRDQTLSAINGLNEVLEENKLPSELQPYSALKAGCEFTVFCSDDLDTDNDGSPDDEENRTGSDPYNHWSNWFDLDADLVPYIVDGTVLDVDMMKIEGDGQVVLKEQPSIKVFTTTAPGADRGQAIMEFNFNQEDDLYTLTVRIGGQPTQTVGGVLLDYEITDAGFTIIGRDPAGVEKFRLMADAAKIGVAGEDAFHVSAQNGAVFAYVNVATNPLDIEYGTHLPATGENSVYGLVFADREGAVSGTNNGGTYELCVGAVCFDLPISRVGFEEGQGPNGLPGLWVDPDGDGNRTYVIPEDVPDIPPELPPTPGTDDEDGDGVPDDAEALLCSTIPIGTDLCDEDDLIIPGLPGGPDGVDDDKDGIPDELEPRICFWEFPALPEDGHCTDDDEDGTDENYHPPGGGGA